MDEPGTPYLMQWFATPIRYYLKLLHDDTITEILRQEERKRAERRADPEPI
jgi:hypothetical protein